jgi:hypothetical protein
MNANTKQMKSSDPTTQAAVNVMRWGWGSIAVNIALAALHGAIAIASGSLAVAAELTHNFLDLVSAIAVLIGLKVAMRKSRTYPYGLCKIENLIAAGIAIMAFVTAYEIARRALAETLAPPRADTWMLVLLFCTWALPLVFSRYELRAARLAAGAGEWQRRQPCWWTKSCRACPSGSGCCPCRSHSDICSRPGPRSSRSRSGSSIGRFQVI